MIKIVLIGYGNVGSHLARLFLKTEGVSLEQVYNRNMDAIKHLEKRTAITNTFKNIKNADLYIIAISDYAILEVSNKLKRTDSLIVHTSGSTPIDVLDTHTRNGVFYPLQTFSKNRKVSFKNIPICIESNNQTDLSLLKKLANKISKKIYCIDSEQRKHTHIAAVFVNNFVNHLYYTGNQICKKHHIDPEILQPLILETAKKYKNGTVYEDQTGPARRGDYNTIQKHLLDLGKSQREIYKLLSQSIEKTYE